MRGLRGCEQRADADAALLPAGRGGPAALCLPRGGPHDRRLGGGRGGALRPLHLPPR